MKKKLFVLAMLVALMAAVKTNEEGKPLNYVYEIRNDRTGRQTFFVADESGSIEVVDYWDLRGDDCWTYNYRLINGAIEDGDAYWTLGGEPYAYIGPKSW